MEVTLRRLLRQRLSTEVVIMMVAILVVTLAVGFVVVQRDLNRQLNQQYEYRSLAVAQALASQPGLQQAVLAGDPGGVGHDGGAVFTAVLPKCVGVGPGAEAEAGTTRTAEAGASPGKADVSP